MATGNETEIDEFMPSAAIGMEDVPSNVKQVVEEQGFNLDDFFAIPVKDVDALYSQRFCRSQAGTDSVFDPFFSRQSAQGNGITEDDQAITGLSSVQEWLTPLEWLESSTMARGVPACWTTPEAAFRQGWRFVEDRESGKRLEDTDLLKRLQQIDRQWKVRTIVPSAAQISAVFGRALVYRTQISRLGRKKRWELRVVPIAEEYIHYNDNNEITKFTPFVRWGRGGSKQVTIKPTDAVLFIRAKDPLGNSYSGIPAHAFAFKTIIRGELMTKSYTNLVVNRGLGVMLVGITAGTPNKSELQKYASMVGDPGSRSIIFYPKNLFEIDVKDGMKAGFSFSDIDDRLSKHLSMCTNLPQMKMEGVQSGAVTGSETDQDNTAENYVVEQGYHHDSIIDVYVMIDPTLADEDGVAPFELTFPFDIKLDKKKQSEIFQMEAASVTMVEDAITFGEVRDRLGYSPPEDDDDAKKIYSVYINDLRNENDMGENPDIEDTNPDTNPAIQMMDKRGTKAAKTKDTDSLLKAGFSKRDVLKILRAVHGQAVSMTDVKELNETEEDIE